MRAGALDVGLQGKGSYTGSRIELELRGPVGTTLDTSQLPFLPVAHRRPCQARRVVEKLVDPPIPK
jgi:hypothetical protein